jgi:hypothetical protein
MKFTVYVKVVMPDGSVGSFPALRYYPSDDGKNPAVAATFNTHDEASRFAQYILMDKTEIREEKEKEKN